MKTKRFISFLLILTFAVILFAGCGCDHDYKAVKKVTGVFDKGYTEYKCTKCGDTYTKETKAKKSIKILAIGNSFSCDAVEYMWDMAHSVGCKEIIIGNLNIGGCSLDRHYDNIVNDLPVYDYGKNTDGNWTSKSGVTLEYGLTDEDWDYVTLQQVSGYHGDPDSYQHLEDIVKYLNKNKTNKKCKFAWQMTWAYEGTSDHQDFQKYDNNQMTMYKAITDTVQKKIADSGLFDVIMPSGTAVQNMRTSYLGDHLTRDGFHMSLITGRYTVGLTWWCSLTDFPIDKLTYVPNEYEIQPTLLAAIKESVENAIDTPFEVTQSTYTEDPGNTYLSDRGIDLDNDYTLLDWQPKPYAYWNSTDQQYTKLICKENGSTADNLTNFIASSKMFSKDELPNGTVIAIEEGWMYRPEGWVNDDGLMLQTEKRPDQETARYVIVDDKWWGDFSYRAFNLSKSDGTAIGDDWKTASNNLKIYIPKK